tara:strand:- start:206 stop:649 length:444 start_codon:yes stop_codon:yes gene_type:complete
MEIKNLSSVISELGFPIVIALVSIVILYKLGSYLLGFASSLFGSQQVDRMKAIDNIREEVKSELEDFRKYLEEEINQIQDQNKTVSTIIIRLNDRIRILNETIVALDTSSRIFFGMAKRDKPQQTLHEQREELEDQLNRLNPKNGDH